jgi:hypothetical protein
MTNLKSLNVSLTKHGAHKIADLVKKYPRAQVLGMLWGKVSGVNVEEAQAKKILSVSSAGMVPEFWDDARKLGDVAVDSLVLLAIIFSHHLLIKAMREGRTDSFRGTIKRGVTIGDKSYTNFAHVIEQLGYSTAHDPQAVKYNLQPLFSIAGLHTVAIQLFALKLRAAGWDGKGSLLSELVGQNFHEVLNVDSDQFIRWLTVGSLAAAGALEDALFFSGVDEVPIKGNFVFKSGHTPKKTGSIGVTPTQSEVVANLRHNEIQTDLYTQLVKKYGAGNVGTEVPTGDGTAVDIVVNTGHTFWFYEIKIADTLRAGIRQAIPQLLEYAFWRCEDDRAEKLFIVAEFPLSEAADKYLQYLRTRFTVPIYYLQHSLPI